jgi:hypothetical protein
MILGAAFVVAGILMWIGCGVIARQRGIRATPASASPA